MRRLAPIITMEITRWPMAIGFIVFWALAITSTNNEG